jgi:hypothetical protein
MVMAAMVMAEIMTEMTAEKNVGLTAAIAIMMTAIM